MWLLLPDQAGIWVDSQPRKEIKELSQHFFCFPVICLLHNSDLSITFFSQGMTSDAMPTWCLAHRGHGSLCTIQGVPVLGCPWRVSLVLGPLRAPPQGGGVSPGMELSLSFSSLCLLCWLGSKSSWPRTMLLNRDWNVRNSCTVFAPRLISPTNVSSAWQPWVQLGLTVSLSSCAF